jgi:hypothetical protein
MQAEENFHQRIRDNLRLESIQFRLDGSGLDQPVIGLQAGGAAARGRDITDITRLEILRLILN